MKIALYSPPCYGKTALAEYLRDAHGFWLMNFTDLIKETAVDMLNFANLDVAVEDVVREKERFRPFLAMVSKTLDFNGGYGIDQLIEMWQAAGSPQNVVFDNVRYLKQYEKLMPYGFVLVGLNISGDEWAARAEKKGTTPYELKDTMKRDMEPIFPDITINADGPVHRAAETLLRLAGIAPIEVPELEEYAAGKDRVLYRI